jgi:hypothetical protein
MAVEAEGVAAAATMTAGRAISDGLRGHSPTSRRQPQPVLRPAASVSASPLPKSCLPLTPLAHRSLPLFFPPPSTAATMPHRLPCRRAIHPRLACLSRHPRRRPDNVPTSPARSRSSSSPVISRLRRLDETESEPQPGPTGRTSDGSGPNRPTVPLWGGGRGRRYLTAHGNPVRSSYLRSTSETSINSAIFPPRSPRASPVQRHCGHAALVLNALDRIVQFIPLNWPR